MIIEVARVPAEGRAFAGQEEASILDIAEDAVLRSPEPVRYELRAERIPGGLLVQGRLSSAIETRCGRCGEFFRCPLDVGDFMASYEVSDPSVCVDLTPDMREAIVMAFPNHPVCATGCRGLCAGCGANLNEEACRCANRTAGSWGSLWDLDISAGRK
jgi:uncharacterized protein